MLAANSDLEFGPSRSPALNAPAHQLPDAMLVKRLERIVRKYSRLPFVHVVGKETAGIVAGQPHAHLRQVIGPKRKEFRNLGNLSSKDCGPGNLDHRAN